MKAPSVSFVSLGCPKNLVDSEKMMGLLAEAGCPIASDGMRTDVVVVNTCGFLSASRDEALGILREIGRRKQRGEVRRIVVAGCLVQRDGTDLMEQVPEIDALIGVNNREDVVAAVMTKTTRPTARKIQSAARRAGEPLVYLAEYHPLKGRAWTDQARWRLTPRHFAYVRISEGCDQKCTFCTIPSIRGPMHSKPIERITAECRELIDDGARELILIGQDTTSYGRDLGADGLDVLLRELNRLEGARWIRLMYVYPSEVTDAMIDAIAESDRIVKYIDIPLQHINDRILKAMHRRTTRRQTETLLDKLRTRIPGVTIRTTFIAGFPGETEPEFDELRQFIETSGFDAVGVFPYSTEPQTPAGRMKKQHDDAIRQNRAAELMETQQRCAFARAATYHGRTLDVLIDGPPVDGVFPGRHAGQAPDIDSVTYVQGDGLETGMFYRARVTGHRGYDLTARPVGERLAVLK